MSAIADIARAVRADTRDGIRLVGIDGPSASGKSTLARQVARALDAPVLQVDDFVAWDDFSGWWPRFDAQVLQPLLAGHDARYQVRDWAGDPFGRSLGGWKTQPWHPVIVIEGVTCTRRAASALLSCRVWVEVPADLRLRRGLERDGDDYRGYWERWMAAEAAFFRHDDTRARADVIFDGTTAVDGTAADE